MSEICANVQFSADSTLYAGDALVLDAWLPLGVANITSIAPVLYGYDVFIIIGPPEGPLGPG